jgi:L-alanine-DL-glutamate epimerase-like enolase superfamily enzyme
MDALLSNSIDRTESRDDRIAAVTAYPLVQRLPRPTETSWGRYDRISIVMVEVVTEAGLVGAGEVLARFAPRAYCELIATALAPRILGRDPDDISGAWNAMRRALSGRACGVLVEAISGVDIALWDIRGKVEGRPLYALLGASSPGPVSVYAASVNWADDGAAREQVAAFIEAGFDRIKIKIGRSPEAAARRALLIRDAAGDDVTLYADANWAYALDEACYVGDALHAAGYAWFEEPLDPDDEAGYEALASRLSIPLAAGESNFTALQAARLLRAGAVGFLQPNLTRAGGITETVHAVRSAREKGVKYAAHVGMSGIICETASLHIAAATGVDAQIECAMTPNAFKSAIADLAPGYARASHGSLNVPEGPGLGLEIDWDAVRGMCDA